MIAIPASARRGRRLNHGEYAGTGGGVTMAPVCGMAGQAGDEIAQSRSTPLRVSVVTPSVVPTARNGDTP
jgi:hypothetical protein